MSAVPHAPTPVNERHRSFVVISFGISHLYNGAPLAFRVRMKTFALLLAVLCGAALPAVYLFGVTASPSGGR